MSADDPRKSRPRSELMIVAGLCLVAAILIVPSLGDRSLWLDEAYSLQIARLSGPQFWDALRHEPNMPLFYLLLHWVTPLTAADPMLRAISATAAILAVAVFYAMARLSLSVAGAAVATALFAINPLLVRYGQEARGYALSMLFAITASYLLLVALRSRRIWLWPLYGVVIAAAIYSQLAAILVLAAHAVTVILSRKRTSPWAAGAAITVVVLLVPLGLLFAERGDYSLDFAAENAVGRLFTLLRAALPPPGVAVLALSILVVPVGCAVLLLRKRLVSDESRLALFWLTVPFWLAALYSLVQQPVFVVRYFVTSVPAVVLLVAIALSQVRAPAVRASVLAAAVALSLAGLVHWYAFGAGEAEEWREAAGYVAAHADSRDGILFFAPKTRLAFENYFIEADGPASGTRAVYPALTWGDASALLFVRSGDIPLTPGEVAMRTKSFERIWLVLSHYRGSANESAYGAVLYGLQQEFVAVSRVGFEGVELVEYLRRS
jgi:mannosyltransferase